MLGDVSLDGLAVGKRERMISMLNIRIEKTQNPKPIPGEDNPLKFGTIFTDHMFIMNYETGKGWHDPRIVEYQPIVLEPSAMVFH